MPIHVFIGVLCIATAVAVTTLVGIYGKLHRTSEGDIEIPLGLRHAWIETAALFVSGGLLLLVEHGERFVLVPLPMLAVALSVHSLVLRNS